MLKTPSFYMDTYTKTFVPTINCVIDDALLKTMPDIDQALLLNNVMIINNNNKRIFIAP